MRTSGVAYYNEIDPGAAAWLRELIRQGHIAPGDVDTRSITEVRADDLKGYDQVHFFAGIGGWSHALRLAGWADDRPVWTGSCPCQPFSSAGRQRGTDDARHLWPVMLRLVKERRPPVVFGEQIASRLGRQWLAGVRADVEALDYALGAADLCAAGAGEEAEGRMLRGSEIAYERITLSAPNIRQRLWWVAVSQDFGAPDNGETRQLNAVRDRPIGGLADAQRAAWRTVPKGGDVIADGQDPRRKEAADQPGVHREVGRLGHADDAGLQGRPVLPQRHDERPAGASGLGHWSAFDLVACRDGYARRVEPGTFPLAHGLPARVGRLRGYGNAINPYVAAAFIRAAAAA